MKKILAILTLSLVGISSIHASSTQSAPQISIALKPRQPNWRFEIVQSYPQGTPQSIIFYEPLALGGERPVKQVVFYENNRIAIEMDLTVVDEDSDAAREWKSPFVPHGARVDFSPEGK